MTPLPAAPARVALRIVAVGDGDEAALRLTELGLRPGAVVEVLGAAGRDPLLVSVGDARLAVGRELAALVGVEISPAARCADGGGDPAPSRWRRRARRRGAGGPDRSR